MLSQRDLALHLDADVGVGYSTNASVVGSGIGMQARPLPFCGGMERSRCWMLGMVL
jgi:hypothetical protein